MSLSIVPGIPTTFIPCSLESASAPRYDPSPPITTIPSISLFLRLCAAIALNLGSLNSRHLAVNKRVPPLSIIPDTKRSSIGKISSLSIPRYPL